jgi:hypothetical protein
LGRINQHRLDDATHLLADFENMHNAGILQFRVYLFKLKYLLEKADNHIPKALEYAETYYQLNDSLNNVNIQLAAIGEQVKYQTQLKEQQIQLQRAALKNSQLHTRIMLIAAGGVVLLLLLLITYKNYRNVLDKNKLIQTFSRQLIDSRESERNRLAYENNV